MSIGAALGCAIYFDQDLSAGPGPLVELLAGLTAPYSAAELRQNFVAETTQQVGRGQGFDLDGIQRKVESGTVATVMVETRVEANPDHLIVTAETTPATKLRPTAAPQHWKYVLSAGIGASVLDRLGAAQVIDGLVVFADAVNVLTGVMHWGETTSFVSGLAMGATGGLTPAQDAMIRDSLYWRSRWGTIIRGPAWGTFLGAAHVERLGGIAAVRAGTGAERVVALRSGGAFVQLTSVEAPILEGDGDPRLDRAAAFFRPVMGAPAA